MAFLAAAVRWPDALTQQLAQWDLLDADTLQPSPLLLISTASALVLLTTVLTYALRRTPRGITAQPISIAAGARGAQRGAESAGVRRKQPLSTALVGPQGAGKTALYSTLLYGLTPNTQTSQQSSSVTLSLEAEEGGGRASVVLHDLPGHPRLRPLAKHVQVIAGADVLLFCVDTVAALGGSGAAAEPLSATVDYLHTTLMGLARQRLGVSLSKNRNPIPPAFAILLTRADLSPLLAGSFAGTAIKEKEGEDVTAAAAARAKRLEAASAVLLSRARAALETELRKRRAADVDLAAAASSVQQQRQAKAKIGGMSEVARGEGEGLGGGVLAQVLGIFGLAGLVRSKKLAGDDSGRLGGLGDEGEDEGDDVPDYYLGNSASGGATATSAFSLDKLDPEVVADGQIPILLSTVGRERGWEVGGSSSGAGFDGLAELRRWIVSLAA
ncbi:hypothetical protein OC844_005376 [Tilletia horrida]|nr:hypothetical protein OC844_005376 [Tilletia horrida]